MTPPNDSTLPGAKIPYEQAVFGSFAFWDQGYGILGRSPGCRDEWLADFRAVCGRYGERPSTAAESVALFALKLKSGPWAVVGVFPQGRDDVGRPGALAFHALFLKGSDYRKAGAFPFPFRSLLREDWTADDRVLPSGVFSAPRRSDEPAPLGHEAEIVARAVARGACVLVESPTPIDDLATEVWTGLPPSVRAKAGLSTWSFAASEAFRLIGMPRVPPSPAPPFVRLETLIADEAAAPADDGSRLGFDLLRTIRALGRRHD